MKTTVAFNESVAFDLKDAPSDMPRYVLEAEYADGSVYWRYNPPQNAIDAGVVERCVLGDDRLKAWTKADKFNADLDEWVLKDAGILEAKGMAEAPTVDGLVRKFFEDWRYTRLSPKTQNDYKFFLRAVCKTEVQGVPLGAWKFKNITKAVAGDAYSQWVQRGAHLAEHMRSSCRRLWNLGEKWELIYTNPWKHIEAVPLPERKVVWTQDQITKFLDTAFTKPAWANIGMIVLLAYELGQRLVDMRSLEWSEYYEEDAMFKFTQTKRGVDMSLPVNEGLKEMLHQQRQKTGGTKYICPHPKTGEMYSETLVSKTGRRIANAAGVPKELRLSDMRRTAVTEAADGGATLAQIMSMTGHQNAASVKPYLRKSKTQAESAMNARGTLLTKKVDKKRSVKSK